MDYQTYAGGGIVRKLTGRLTQRQRHIPGKPDTVNIPGYGTVEAAPIKEIEGAADSYMKKSGLGFEQELRPAIRYGDKVYKAPVGSRNHDDVAIPDSLRDVDFDVDDVGFTNRRGHYLRRDAAQEYGRANGLILPEYEDMPDLITDGLKPHKPHRVERYEDFDEDRARRIAEAFDRMKHDPTDPEVRRSYDAMISETLDQYQSLKDAGVDIRFLKDGEADPYARSPALGYVDLVENGRLVVFPTDQGFGTLTEITDNPLLKRVGKVGDMENATANDAFRAVHDLYGHFGPGNPFFRHKGEERAWVNHSKMYSPDALPAMTTETRGQNSWLNFGPHAEHNRNALGADTIFADQKIGLLPEWAYKGYATGGLVQGMAATADYQDLEPEQAMFLGRKARNAPHQFLDYVERKLQDVRKQYPSNHPDDRANRGMADRWIWQDDLTGINRDGKLMYELDDSQSRLKDIPDFGPRREDYQSLNDYLNARMAWQNSGKIPPSNHNMTVGDMLEHPELYEAYPELKDTRLRWDNSMDAYGTMQSDIDGNPQILTLRALGRDPKQIHGTLLHELQHGVQAREGWSRGSNHDIGRMLVGKQDRIEQKLLDMMTAHDLMAGGKDFADPEIRSKMFGHLPDNEYLSLVEEAKRTPEERVQELWDQSRKARRAFTDVHGAYERNAGEIEARNTTNRQFLDYDSRRRSYWKDTEDRQGEPRIVETPDGPVLSWD